MRVRGEGGLWPLYRGFFILLDFKEAPHDHPPLGREGEGTEEEEVAVCDLGGCLSSCR